MGFAAVLLSGDSSEEALDEARDCLRFVSEDLEHSVELRDGQDVANTLRRVEEL